MSPECTLALVQIVCPLKAKKRDIQDKALKQKMHLLKQQYLHEHTETVYDSYILHFLSLPVQTLLPGCCHLVTMLFLMFLGSCYTVAKVF